MQLVSFQWNFDQQNAKKNLNSWFHQTRRKKKTSKTVKNIAINGNEVYPIVLKNKNNLENKQRILRR